MSEEQPPRFDEAQLQYALEQLRGEQNMPAGIMAGLLAALVGAAVWAVVTVVTKMQIGFMAIGIGFLVGYAVRTFGKGIDRSFAFAGALLALAGCVLGNLLAVCGLIAAEQEMPFMEVVAQLDPQIAWDLMVASFSPMDIVFYAIAVYEGWRLSALEVGEEELARRITGERQAG